MTSYRFGPFRLVPGVRLLERDGVTVNLTPKALELLVALVQNRSRALATEEILATVWPGLAVEDGNVAQQVHLLRKTLGDTGEWVQTVPRYGYRFSAPVEELTDDGNQVRATQHCLIWDQRAFRLREGATVIGRADDADVQVLLPSVSRHHARIVVRAGEASIEDLGSKHGTWRAGARVIGASPLASGDAIHMGTAELVYRFTRPDDTTV